MAAATEGVEIVFHLAALIAIPYSYAAPQSFIDTNVSGHAATPSRRPGRRASGASSRPRRARSTARPRRCRSSRPTRYAAQSPYAASKVAADQLTLAFGKSFELPVVVLRPFNTYGPRQSERAVLPTMLRQLLAGRTEVRLGRLDPRRDLTFVADTVDGFIRAATAPGIEGEVIQLGTGRSESIAELFALASRILGVDARAVEDPARLRPDASEVMVLQADPSRARERLGWEARTSLEDGLARDHRLAAHPARDQRPGSCPDLSRRIPLVGAVDRRERRGVPRGVPRHQLRVVGRAVRGAVRARAFAAAVGARHAVACSSGTAAIHLALRVLDVGPGDDVLVADLTFVASVNPIAYVGARPILVDAEAAT